MIVNDKKKSYQLDNEGPRPVEFMVYRVEVEQLTGVGEEPFVLEAGEGRKLELGPEEVAFLRPMLAEEQRSDWLELPGNPEDKVVFRVPASGELVAEVRIAPVEEEAA
jgi:hypothetical protein